MHDHADKEKEGLVEKLLRAKTPLPGTAFKKS